MLTNIISNENGLNNLEKCSDNLENKWSLNSGRNHKIN